MYRLLCSIAPFTLFGLSIMLKYGFDAYIPQWVLWITGILGLFISLHAAKETKTIQQKA